MRKPANIIAASTVAALLSVPALVLPGVASADLVADGKKVAENRKKGNCFTCHDYKGAHLAGNIGPPFIAMKARFPDKAKLRAQIWDATASNPNSMMPPFGKHGVLSEKEIDALTEWVLTF